ncbi:MAG: glycosyltransferase family 4 protein [Phototrophicaceae bacterium]
MRIGLITGEYPPLQGGVSSHVAMLAHYLTHRGHQVFVFSNNRAEQQQDDIPLMNTISKWNYQTNRLVQDWVETHNLDIVNLHFQTAAYDMSPWVHFMPHNVSVPFVTTFHDLRFPYLFPKAGRLRDWIVMHLARASSGIIITNHEDLQSVKHLQSQMIPIGSSIERAIDVDSAAIRQKLGLQADDFLLAHFGFINHSKGIDTLLHAIASLNDPSIKLLMIGGRTGTADPTNATYADTVDALMKDLGLIDQVLWTGFVSNNEVGMYLQTADTVVLPFRDGASFRRSSLMAAIEQYCPIITTTPIVPIPEFTLDVMLLVEPENVTQLATAIETLHYEPEKRDALQQNVQKLRQRFDWHTITSDTVQLFQTILEQRA